MSLGGRGAPAGATWAGEFQGAPRERAGWADQFQAEHAPGAAWAEQYAAVERFEGWANEFSQAEAAAVRPDILFVPLVSLRCRHGQQSALGKSKENICCSD